MDSSFEIGISHMHGPDMNSVSDIEDRLMDFLKIVTDAPSDVQKLTDQFMRAIDLLKKNYIKSLVRKKRVGKKYYLAEEYVHLCENEYRKWRRKNSYLDQVCVEERKIAFEKLDAAKLELAMGFSQLQVAEREMDLTIEQLDRLSKVAENDFMWSLRKHSNRCWIQLYDKNEMIKLPSPPLDDFNIMKNERNKETLDGKTSKEQKETMAKGTLRLVKEKDKIMTTESSEDIEACSLIDEQVTRIGRQSMIISSPKPPFTYSDNIDEGIGDVDWNEFDTEVDDTTSRDTTRHHVEYDWNKRPRTNDYSVQFSSSVKPNHQIRRDGKNEGLKRQPSIYESDVPKSLRRIYLEGSLDHLNLPCNESNSSQLLSNNYQMSASRSTFPITSLGNEHFTHNDRYEMSEPGRKCNAFASRPRPGFNHDEYSYKQKEVASENSARINNNDIPWRAYKTKEWPSSDTRLKKSLDRSIHSNDLEYSHSAIPIDKYQQQSRTRNNNSDTDYMLGEETNTPRNCMQRQLRESQQKYSTGVDGIERINHLERFRKSIDSPKSIRDRHQRPKNDGKTQTGSSNLYGHSKKCRNVEDFVYWKGADTSTMARSHDRSERQPIVFDGSSQDSLISRSRQERTKSQVEDPFYLGSGGSGDKATLDERFRRPDYSRAAKLMASREVCEQRDSPTNSRKSSKLRIQEAMWGIHYSDNERMEGRLRAKPSVICTDEINVSSIWENHLVRQRTSSSEHPPSFDQDSDIVSTTEILSSSTMSEYASSVDRMDDVKVAERTCEGQLDIGKEKKGKRKKKKIWQFISNVLHGPWEGWESE